MSFPSKGCVSNTQSSTFSSVSINLFRAGVAHKILIVPPLFIVFRVSRACCASHFTPNLQDLGFFSLSKTLLDVQAQAVASWCTDLMVGGCIKLTKTSLLLKYSFMLHQHQEDGLSVQVIVENDNFPIHRFKTSSEWQIILLNVFAPVH